GDDRPEIVVGVDMDRVVDEAESALRQHSLRPVYVRGRRLVVIAHEGGAPIRGLVRADGAIRAHPLEDESLRERLAASALWMKKVATKKGGFKKVPTLPPAWAARALAARGEWTLPPLNAI